MKNKVLKSIYTAVDLIFVHIFISDFAANTLSLFKNLIIFL